MSKCLKLFENGQFKLILGFSNLLVTVKFVRVTIIYYEKIEAFFATLTMIFKKTQITFVGTTCSMNHKQKNLLKILKTMIVTKQLLIVK